MGVESYVHLISVFLLPWDVVLRIGGWCPYSMHALCQPVRWIGVLLLIDCYWIGPVLIHIHFFQKHIVSIYYVAIVVDAA